MQHLAQSPRANVDRLKHYFLTYKQIPGGGKRQVEIAEVYDRPEALEVTRRSMKDYQRLYGQTPARAKRPAARKR